MRVALGKRALRSGHYVFRGALQFFGKASQELKVAPGEALRTSAADKFDAPILADFRAAADKEHTDLPGALDVGAAAGLQISRLYFDDAEDAVPLDFFSHAELRQLVRGSVAHVDRAILEDNLVCGALGALQRYCGLYEVDAVLLSHLHADHCIDMCAYYVARNYRLEGCPDPPDADPAGHLRPVLYEHRGREPGQAP